METRSRVYEIYLSFHFRLQQPIPGQLLRISGGPNTSPSQMPESTTHHHYGLKVDPYTLDHPGSPTYIDPITGEVTQRPHTTHVSPPVVTSTMMSNGSSKYRKQYKLSSNNKGSSPTSSGGSYHDGSNNFISQFGPNSYDHHHHSSHNGLGNQVSYATSSHIGPPWSSHAHNQPHHSWRREVLSLPLTFLLIRINKQIYLFGLISLKNSDGFWPKLD